MTPVLAVIYITQIISIVREMFATAVAAESNVTVCQNRPHGVVYRIAAALPWTLSSATR